MHTGQRQAFALPPSKDGEELTLPKGGGLF